MDALTGMGVILYNLGNHTWSMSFFNKVLTVNSTTKNDLFGKGILNIMMCGDGMDSYG
jgi:hypothetical protein